MLKKWREVYCTSEMEKFFAAKNLLAEEGITFKTDTTDNSLRLSMNDLGGRTGAALSRGNVKNFYTVLVEESDEARARYLLAGLDR